MLQNMHPELAAGVEQHSVTHSGGLYNFVSLSSGLPIASPIIGANVSYFDQRADLVCDPSKGAPHTATVCQALA